MRYFNTIFLDISKMFTPRFLLIFSVKKREKYLQLNKYYLFNAHLCMNGLTYIMYRTVEATFIANIAKIL